jgi:16S rRNA (cytosine1402-N4)-methyltransferase
VPSGYLGSDMLYQHKEAISHVPVLMPEVMKIMEPKPGKKYIDCTGGPGNMSAGLLAASSPDGKVLTLDFDPRTSEEQTKLLGEFGERSVRRLSNFSNLHEIALKEGFEKVNGILFDLGLSSRMIDTPEYGASFQIDSPLDMRMDPELTETAGDLVNQLPERELADLFRGMDEARWANRIARAIVKARLSEPIETTGQLANIVSNAIPRKFHSHKMHPATRVFLALRVEVNHEQENLTSALQACPELLSENGVLAVICYSSFEDRIVRHEISETKDRWVRVTKKAIRPGDDEIRDNPRSRSARLRAYRKVA